MMMIHDPMALSFGNAVDLQRTIDLLHKAKDNMLVPTYAARTGEKTSAEQIAKLMSDETWFSASEAVAAGLADSVIGKQEVQAYVDPELFDYQRVPDQFSKPSRRTTPWNRKPKQPKTRCGTWRNASWPSPSAS